jgi:hypothetical protein
MTAKKAIEFLDEQLIEQLLSTSTADVTAAITAILVPDETLVDLLRPVLPGGSGCLETVVLTKNRTKNIENLVAQPIGYGSVLDPVDVQNSARLR